MLGCTTGDGVVCCHCPSNSSPTQHSCCKTVLGELVVVSLLRLLMFVPVCHSLCSCIPHPTRVQAIRDGGIDAILQHDDASGLRSMVSRESGDVYSSLEPQAAFHTRVAFCLNLHNDAVKVQCRAGCSTAYSAVQWGTQLQIPRFIYTAAQFGGGRGDLRQFTNTSTACVDSTLKMKHFPLLESLSQPQCVSRVIIFWRFSLLCF